MSTLIQLSKELLALLALLMVVNIVLQYFFKRSLVGRLIYMTVKNLILAIKLTIKAIKKTIQLTYKGSKKTYKFLNNLYKQHNQKNTKKPQKKVANGEQTNVIDLKKFMAGKQHQRKSR